MIQQIEEEQVKLLLNQIKCGDEEAFEEFFCLYQPSIFRFLYHYTGERQAAEDLTQDTFIKFWQVRQKLDSAFSPTALLFRIARNLGINHATRKPPLQPIYNQDELLVTICRDPEKEYDQAFLMDDFQKAINTLPERCRAIFILSRYQNLGYSEIAESLQISLQTVKNQMNKAISILKKRLSSHLD